MKPWTPSGNLLGVGIQLALFRPRRQFRRRILTWNMRMTLQRWSVKNWYNVTDSRYQCGTRTAVLFSVDYTIA